MGIPLKQASFVGGEVAPALYARTDLQRYAHSLRSVRNFLVLPLGGLSNRPGTKLTGAVKDHARRVRLWRFVFNDDQTYLLEWGHLYLRVYSFGGAVLNGSGIAVEIATPYEEIYLSRLEFAQSADTVTITHPFYEPRELKRLAHDSWQLSIITFTPSIAQPAGLAWVSGDTVDDDPVNPLKDWEWAVTAIAANGEESVPSTKLPKTASVIPSKPARIQWNAVAGAVEYRVYRGRNGLLGFVGSVVGDVVFDDDGQSPDYTDTPPTGENPFSGVGNYPSAVAYQGQRRVFGGGTNNPEKLRGSQVGNYRNFGASSPAKEDDAYDFTIAARQVNEIRHLVPLRALLVLTAGAEYVAAGADGGPISPISIDVRPHTEHGASYLPVDTVGPSAVFVDRTKRKLRDLHFDYSVDGYRADDLTLLAFHLFEGYELVDLAVSQDPHSIVWVVRSDGVLLGLTYLPDREVVAWHRHDTDGVVENVCTVPEGNETAVYVVVRRTIGGQIRRFIERFASREVLEVEDAFFVDSGLSYDGRHVGGRTVTLTSPTGAWTSGTELTAQASAGSDLWTLQDVGQQLDLRSGTSRVRVTIVSLETGIRLRVRAERNVSTALQSQPIATWSLCRKRLGGLSHLEGKTVAVLVDGHVHPQVVVAGGAIELQYHGARIHAGLPYVSEIETLDLVAPDAGVVRDRRKIVSRVTLELERSRGGKVGTEANRLQDARSREATDGYDDPPPLATDALEIAIGSTWKTGPRLIVQQSDPLPLTILALHAETTPGG